MADSETPPEQRFDVIDRGLTLCEVIIASTLFLGLVALVGWLMEWR